MPLRARVVAEVAEINSVREVLRYMRTEFFALGAKQMSYHLVPPLNNPLNRQAVIIQAGLPEEFIELYADVSVRNNDPIATFVMRYGKMMTWQQALAAQHLTDDQKTFMKSVLKFNMIDGLAIPLFGPNGRNGYCAVCLDRVLTDADKILALEFQELITVGHNRLCDIINARERTKCILSARETDILHWICRGKSNRDIATITGLASASVDTYVRRAFTKLGANSRIGASVRALSLGLVKL